MNDPNRIQLLLRFPNGQVQMVPLNQGVVTIGRAPDNTITLPITIVSGHHARIEPRSNGWYFIDIGSSNGSFLNGQRLPHQQVVALTPGTQIVLGQNDQQGVVLLAEQLALQPQAPAAYAPPPQGYAQPQTAMQEAPPPQTIMLQRDSSQQQREPVITIGRNPASSMVLSSPSVSWNHARIEQTANGEVITDLGSSNGTYVNGQRITAPYRLQPNDRIQVGPFRVRYNKDAVTQMPLGRGVRLDGMQVTKRVNNGKKIILNNIDISIAPCEFVALVGPSGAGKSSLMKALSGYERTEGVILVDGDNLYEQFEQYRAEIGYVPQDDIIHRNLTVQGALMYAARLRLPPDTRDSELKANVDRALRYVEMEGHTDTPISRLSGGQRKRVSIAVELLADPKLFFLDEPTSGLDPGLEKALMESLNKLAKNEGKTIILVTHATASISECDHVCFLAQGRLVYFGPPREALEFFDLPTDDLGGFAQIYRKIDSSNRAEANRLAEEWEQRYRQSPQYRRYVQDRKQQTGDIQRQAVGRPQRSQPKVNWWQQFTVLTSRYFELVLRDRVLSLILLAVMPFIGLCLVVVAEPDWLVGLTATEVVSDLEGQIADGEAFGTYAAVPNAQQLLFIMAIAIVLLGVLASSYEIAKEHAIYRNERMATLRVVPYLASKLVVLGAFSLVQALLFLGVVRLRVDFPDSGVVLPAFAEMYITVVLGAVAAISIGLFISALVPNTEVVPYVVLVVVFIQFTFAGILFEVEKPLSYPIVSRWLAEGLGVSANIPHLNDRGQILFDPDPVTETVEIEVERPPDDWEPVTVTTQQIQPEVCVAPIEVPLVTENERITITEVLSRTETIDPEPVQRNWEWDIPVLEYEYTFAYLARIWGFLIAFAGLFSGLTTWALFRKDKQGI